MCLATFAYQKTKNKKKFNSKKKSYALDNTRKAQETALAAAKGIKNHSGNNFCKRNLFILEYRMRHST